MTKSIWRGGNILELLPSSLVKNAAVFNGIFFGRRNFHRNNQVTNGRMSDKSERESEIISLDFLRTIVEENLQNDTISSE